MLRFLFLIAFIAFNRLSLAAESDVNRFNQTLESIKSVQEQLQYAQSIESSVEHWPAEPQGMFYHTKGLLLENNKQIDASIQAHTKAITILSAIAPSVTLVEAYQDRSYMIYLQTFDPKAYCPDREKGLSVARQVNDAKVLATALVHRSFCFSTPNTFITAKKLLTEALAISEREHFGGGLQGIIYNATGNAYRNIGLHKQALDYYQTAYQSWSKVNSWNSMFNMLHNMISEAIALKLWSKTQQFVEQSFAMADNHPNFKDFRFFAHLNDGRNQYSQHQYLAAKKALLQALALKTTTKEQHFIRYSYYFLALTEFRLGNLEAMTTYAQWYLQGKPDQEKERRQLLEINALTALGQKDYQLAFETMFDRVALETEKMSEIIQNDYIQQAFEHDLNLIDYEKKLLEQELAINKLHLQQQADQDKIKQLSIILAVSLLVLLSGLLVFMYRSRAYFKKRAHSDGLTGIANRRYILEQGDRQFEKHSQQERCLSVLVLDIDHFKSINDNYGHAIGDQAIKATTKLAQHRLRAQDMIGRIGGEEFIVILPDADVAVASDVAERIRYTIANHCFKFDDCQLQFTISIGIATLAAGSASFTSLMNLADIALYQAKKDGRNCVRIHKEAGSQ
ncbi:GGDEF domain-containing protein [Thalassotalea insulae]|uniref:GGDEF domain-containing protein n=1 Tax=Thalassotalea insulae TaxID=2056778 RepID=UPI0024E11D7E|nr:GGDEF domain-containing protein [Thalassotalea insulae]